jgi:hypothetical protein
LCWALCCSGRFWALCSSLPSPKHHLSEESKDIIKIATGLIATLVALVLGLLVASAKSSFDTKSDELKDGAARIILLDRTLKRFGPPAEEARSALRHVLTSRLEVPWREESLRTLGQDMTARVPSLDDVEDRIRELAPATESQRSLQARALQLTTDLTQVRWLLAQQVESAISIPFLVVVVSWLTVIFASLGLMAPRNTTVLVVIVLCAMAVSTAVLLILELDRPFQGLITLSKEPLRNALNQLQP